MRFGAELIDTGRAGGGAFIQLARACANAGNNFIVQNDESAAKPYKSRLCGFFMPEKVDGTRGGESGIMLT